MRDDLLIKIARIVVAYHGELYLPRQLIAEIRELNARLRRGEKPTLAEINVVLNEVEATPGYAEWNARQMLGGVLAKLN